jgi:hypothetical protein
MKSLLFAGLLLLSTAAVASPVSDVKRVLADKGVSAEVFDAHYYVAVGCFGANPDACLAKARETLVAAGFRVQAKHTSLAVTPAKPTKN